MKGMNPGMMLENPKQNEGIECGRDAGEHETKRRVRIWEICLRTQNKREGLNTDVIPENLKCKRIQIKIKGSNLGTIPENPKEREGIESGRDTEEPEKKEERIESSCNARELESK